MTGKRTDDKHSLRTQAESQLRDQAKKTLNRDVSGLDLAELVHELNVHQIELEIQNDELRRAQEELLNSRQRFTDLFHQAPIGYLVLDQSGFVRDVNETFCHMTDQLASKIKNHSVFDLIVEKDRTWFMARYKAFYKNPQKKNMELEILTGGGVALPVRLDAVSYKMPGEDIPDDEALQLLLTVSDISERKRAENALQAQTDLLATVFESAPNILMLVNEDGRLEKINRAGSDFAGSPQEELIGLLGGEVIQCINSFDGQGCGRNPECGACPVRTRMARSMQEGETILNEEGSLTVRRDAREISLDFLISTVPVDIMGITKVLITIVDITERKQAEEHMRYQASLLENVSDAIISTDANFSIQSWNRAAEEVYGWRESEVLGKTVEEVLQSEFQESLKQVLDDFYEERSWRGEATQVRKDGATISVLSSVRLIQDDNGDLVRAIATNRDITERKRAEEALQQSELRNRTILRTALDGFWLVDPESSRILDVNDAYCQMSGYTRDEILQMTISDLEAVETLDEVLEHAQKVKLLGEDRFESLHKRKDGSLFQVEVSIQTLSNDGDRNFAFIRDITARKAAEEALRKSEEQYRLLFDEMLSGFALHEIICDDEGKPVDYRFLAVNSAFEALTGLKADELLGKTVLEAMPEIESYWIERYGRVALDGVTDQFDGYSAAIGKHYEARAFCPEPGKFAVMFHDVTERKIAEDQLSKLVERLDLATHVARMGIWDWDIQKDKLVWDDQMYELYGVTRGDFGGAYDAWLSGIHPDDRETSNNISRRARLGEVEYDTEFRVVWPDNSVHVLKAYGQVIRDDANNPLRMIGVNFDITATKQAENDLRVALTKYKTLFNTMPLGITVTDTDGLVIESNATAEKILGLSQDEHNRRKIDGSEWHIVRPDGTPMPANEYASVLALEENRLVENVEMGVAKPNDELARLTVTADVLPLEGHGVIVVYSDISERKYAEEKLKNLLQEKEILLAEVHHRVKNNMQIIASLLGLQAREIKDERFMTAIEESRNRINSMALVHEQLYRAREYAQIDIGEYIDQLASTLFTMYQVESAQVQLQITAKDVYLSLEKAIPCGLLLNELITNSLKYAFPDGRKGKLWIDLEPSQGNMKLTVGDDGIGIPEDFDFETSQSLGLQLVNLLTIHDLQGNIELRREKGTQFQIEFPVQSRNED